MTKVKICPICGNEYTGYPALSRKDNKTEICPRCGMVEALDDYINDHLTDKENDSNYCIFEERICRFANKNENCFECKAPNDFSMPCRPHKG